MTQCETHKTYLIKYLCNSILFEQDTECIDHRILHEAYFQNNSIGVYLRLSLL